MMQIRRSHERGRVRMGWLDSHHTFSFGSYHDPRFMGFGPLRVINEDRVDPGAGFPTHGHRDMEILSYVVEGALAHENSTGGGGVIHPGEVQVMSAGAGVHHSEMNGSRVEPVHFLQIWLVPTTRGAAPRYAQRDFGRAEGVTLLVSPEGREDSLPIRQDADVYRVRLRDGDAASLALRHRNAWVQVVHGGFALEGERLEPGDGAALTEVTALALTARAPEGLAEALLFDLP